MVNHKKINVFPNDVATHEWLDTLKPGTRNTYSVYWADFLEFVGKNGDQILADRKQDKNHEWERRVLQFKQWLLEKGMGQYSATCAVMVARGFFSFHYMKLEYRRGESRRLGERARKSEDYRFTKAELVKMSEVGDLTERYVLLTGKSFGLRAGDFLSIRRGDVEPYLNREPPICIGPLNTMKENVKAFPFIDPDALPMIKLMIEKMNREGRTNPTDRILTYGQELELSRIIRRLATKAGINFGNRRVRFHCLRKFLCDHLASHMSESKWKMIVGKAVGEKAYISADELRKDYTRAMPEITIIGMTAEANIELMVQKRIMLDKAKDLGLSQEIQDKIMAAITPFDLEEYRKYLKKERDSRTDCTDGKHCQRIVAESELEGFLVNGWHVAATLGSGKIVIDEK
jgi:integrase